MTQNTYVLESGTFFGYIAAQYKRAQDEISQIDREVAEFNAEIDARMVRRADLAVIVNSGSMLLTEHGNGTKYAPAPKIEQHQEESAQPPQIVVPPPVEQAWSEEDGGDGP